MTITEEKMKLQEELSLVTYMSLVMEQRMEIVKLLGINVNSNKTCSDCRNTGQKKIFLNDILSRKENVILQINNQERRNNKYSILHVAEVEYKNVNLT